MFRAVIFDLDGTLVEFKLKSRDAKHGVIEELRRIGFDSSRFSLGDYFQTMLDEAALQIKEKGLPLSYSYVRNRVSEILDRFELQASAEPKLKPGSIQVLEEIRRRGILLGLLTNNGIKATQRVLNLCGLRSYFDVIVTRNDGVRLKPDGEGLKYTLKLLLVTPREAAYVGDSVIDIMAARMVDGVTSISVKGGLYPEDALTRCRPDLIINSLKDLLTLLS